MLIEQQNHNSDYNTEDDHLNERTDSLDKDSKDNNKKKMIKNKPPNPKTEFSKIKEQYEDNFSKGRAIEGTDKRLTTISDKIERVSSCIKNGVNPSHRPRNRSRSRGSYSSENNNEKDSESATSRHKREGWDNSGPKSHIEEKRKASSKRENNSSKPKNNSKCMTPKKILALKIQSNKK